MTDRPEDQAMPGEPPMAPPPPPIASGTIGLESETEVRSGGIGGRIAAGALGLVLLVGGVAFAATQMSSDDGAGNPEDAVEAMFDAIAEEDVLGLLASLDARERDALSQPVEELFEQLERLEVLDESFDLRGIEGVDLEFEGLQFRSEPVRDDLARVYLTGGTATYRVDTDEIPIGDFVSDNLERFGIEYRGIQQTDSETLDGEADDTFLVARKTGDGWRVSLGYTAVEAARLAQGKPVPAAGAGLAPIGADSPEEAVEGFLRAAIGIDVGGAVARLSPGELGAVHDYWPVLVSDVELPTPDDVPAKIELTDLALRSTTDGDRGRVFIDSIGADVVAEGFQGGATVADGCVEVRGDLRTALDEAELDLPDGPICQDDIEAILEEATAGMADMGLGLGGMSGFEDLGLGDTRVPALGITVVRIDGGWFVAPLGTYADIGLAVLEIFDRQHLDSAVDAVEGFFGSGFFAGGAVGGGFLPPGMSDELDGLDGLGDPLAEEPADPATDDVVLAELLSLFTTDPDVAACALEQLQLKASAQQIHELSSAYQHGLEPSVGAQDVLFGVLAACGG